MPDITDFQLGQGESFKIYVQLLHQSGSSTPIDLTDYTCSGQIRENYSTDELAAEFTFTKVQPYASGAFYVELPAEVTATLNQRKYVYDVNISSGSYSGSIYPVTRRILEGGLTVRPAVTR